MIAAIWCSFVIGPIGMALLYRSAVGRRHPRVWRWSSGTGMIFLAALIALSFARISIADRCLVGAAFLLGYFAICAGLLSASSSRREWIASVSLISYLTLGWISFVVALPGFLIFDFFASDLVGTYSFQQDFGEGLSCTANDRGGMDGNMRVSLHRRLAYLPMLQHDLDGRLESAVIFNPEISCREMMTALAARRDDAAEVR